MNERLLRQEPEGPSNSLDTDSFEKKTGVWLVAAFYEFFPLKDPVTVRNWLEDRGSRAGVRGTVLLADEGINGTLAGRDDALRLLLEELCAYTGATLGNAKFSESPEIPFRRFRVRVKPELVTFRQALADPAKQSGTYVPPAEWNELIRRRGVRLVDTRNDYETAIGTFEGAEDPNTENFTDFADYVERELDPERDREIAMFCTGGIRCEKASSYLLAKGFDRVYHLEGGILRYLEEVDSSESSWKGECYVFDERVSVDHSLRPGGFRNCAGCGWPTAHGAACSRCGATE